jgi:peptidoglycan/LPS O-acetylase OafA/YrhL
VLITVLIGTWLILPKVLWENTTREIIAATLYFENWQLAMNAVDYLAQFAGHTVVQHFWAMSIQGQFYLIWLALFWLTWWLSRTFAADRKRVAGIAFVTLIAASLIFSIWETNTNQPFAYFDTRARVWEFALGGLAAISLQSLVLPRAVKLVLGWIGLLGILSCGLILQVSTVFPGYAALWPTSSALLILAAGGTRSRFGADSFLSLKPLVWLGNISYGIYLWHWPVLEFYREISGRYKLGLRSGLFVLGLSIFLAWLTRVFVEDPIQNERRASPRRSANLATATAIAI